MENKHVFIAPKSADEIRPAIVDEIAGIRYFETDYCSAVEITGSAVGTFNGPITCWGRKTKSAKWLEIDETISPVFRLDSGKLAVAQLYKGDAFHKGVIIGKIVKEENVLFD